MESLLIIIVGLIFSSLSKNVKNKKEIENEKNKRKQQLGQENYNTKPNVEKKQKSLRDIFMEELEKVGDEDENLGDIFKKSFAGKTPKEIKQVQVEESTRNVDYSSEFTNILDDEDMSNEEYRAQLEAKVAAYMEPENNSQDKGITQSEIIPGEAQVEHGVHAGKNRQRTSSSKQYNPFTKSINRQDVIRGVIFSEVLDKPKSLRK